MFRFSVTVSDTLILEFSLTCRGLIIGVVVRVSISISGDDTFALGLVSQYGREREHVAAKLRECRRFRQRAQDSFALGRSGISACVFVSKNDIHPSFGKYNPFV